MMSFLSFGVVAGGSTVSLLAGLILARLSAYRPAPDVSENAAPEGGAAPFILAKYQPMAKLLAEEDFEFLKSQPGYRPAIGAKLLRQRRRIFRLYLRELAADFHHLHAEAREIVANSQQPDADLVWVLIRQQATFWRVMTGIELGLLMDRAGLGHVEVRGLLDAFGAIQRDLKRFQAPATAA